jgi:hypothetical protein
VAVAGPTQYIFVGLIALTEAAVSMGMAIL